MPSPYCSQQAKDYLARLRNSYWACPIKDTCDLGRRKLAEIFSEEPNSSNWNEVSIAHLIFAAIGHLRNLGDVKSILEIEALADKELAKVSLAIDKAGEAADIQLKEAFFVLQKAKMSALADRKAYGFQAKPLDTIHSRFREENLPALFEVSREACKAYISLLCLNFEIDKDEFQTNSKQIQTYIDKAMALNSEFLVSKHAYEKYTPKIQIWQLQNTDYMPPASFEALLEDMLSQHPEGKHSISFLQLQSEYKVRWDIPDQNRSLVEKIKSLQIQSSRKLGLEVISSNQPPFHFSIFLLSLKTALRRHGREESLKILKAFHKFRANSTGLPRAEDYLLLLAEASTIAFYPDFMIPELADVLHLLVHKHRKVSELYEKYPCYHDYKVISLYENALPFIVQNPRVGSQYSFAEALAEHPKLVDNMRRADETLREEEGSSFYAYYEELLPKFDITRKNSRLHLDQLREELMARYEEKKEQIEAGRTNLTSNCRAMQILETSLLKVLSKLEAYDRSYTLEIKALIETKLSSANDYYGPLLVVQLYYQTLVASESITLQEIEEALAQLRGIRKEFFFGNSYSKMVRMMETRMTLLKISEMLLSILVTISQLQITTPSTPEFYELQKKYGEQKSTLENQIVGQVNSMTSRLSADREFGLTRKNSYLREIEILNFKKYFFPALEEIKSLGMIEKRDAQMIRVELLEFEKSFFEDFEQNSREEFEMICLTEEGLAVKNKAQFRVLADCLARGASELQQFVALETSRERALENIRAQKKKCQILAKSFAEVDSLIQDFQEQIAFDSNFSLLTAKAKGLKDQVSILKLTKVVQLFLFLEPSNLEEAIAQLNEAKLEISGLDESTCVLQGEFNLDLIAIMKTLKDFVAWAETSWKYAKYLPKIQKPPMKTVVMTTLVLGIIGVSLFKACKK